MAHMSNLDQGRYRIPPRRGRQLLEGAPTYKLAGFSQKLHEIKKILVRRGGAPGAPSWIRHCRYLETEPEPLLISAAILPRRQTATSGLMDN